MNCFEEDMTKQPASYPVFGVHWKILSLPIINEQCRWYFVDFDHSAYLSGLCYFCRNVYMLFQRYFTWMPISWSFRKLVIINSVQLTPATWCNYTCFYIYLGIMLSFLPSLEFVLLCFSFILFLDKFHFKKKVNGELEISWLTSTLKHWNIEKIERLAWNWLQGINFHYRFSTSFWVYWSKQNRY